ncbi:hypothetical protein BH20ACT5_BH20ACT5_13580 [soil metagenome]
MSVSPDHYSPPQTSAPASTAALLTKPGVWTLVSRTAATFGVGNLGKRVTGTIPITSARIEVAGGVPSVTAALDIAGIDTGNARRDKDLRKPALLDLDRHPELHFRSERIVASDEGWTVLGQLTVKDTTRGITLTADADAQPDGSVRVRLTGWLDRRDYGVKAPRFLIGAIVDIQVDVTFVRS